jgi:hypothetical protein
MRIASVLAFFSVAAWCSGFAPGAAAGNCPADVATLPAGQWCEVPNSHMRDVAFNWPAGVTFTQNGVGVAGVMDLWSGGAYDTRRDRLIVWGGGHFGYAGNEIYAFDVSTLAWVRVNDPSIPVGEDVPYAPDGGPTARHTYDYIEYVASIDRFCTFGGAGFYSSGQTGTKNTDCFGFDNLQWEKRAATPDDGSIIGAKAAYDPVTGKVYVQTALQGSLSSYDPATDRWVMMAQGGMDNYLTIAIDPVRRKLIAVGQGEQLVADLSSPGAGFSAIAAAGDMTVVNAQAPGLVYDPVSDRFVGWSGGANVYTLNMDTLVWTKISPASGNTTTPTAANSVGTYGRFRYIPSKNAFIVVNSIDEDVYIYKLSGAAGTPPPSAPAKPTVTVQ